MRAQRARLRMVVVAGSELTAYPLRFGQVVVP